MGGMAGIKGGFCKKELVGDLPIRVVIQLWTSLKELENHLVWTATHVGDTLPEAEELPCNQLQICV